MAKAKDTSAQRNRISNTVELKIFVPGPPQGKGRARVTMRKVKGKLVPHHYTPDETAKYQEIIATEAKCEMVRIRKPKLILKPISIQVLIMAPIPDSWPAWKKGLAIQGFVAPTVKPDEDNVKKAIYDALNGVVWKDDTQVVSSKVDKVYTHRVGLGINIETVNQYPANMLTKISDVDSDDLANPEWEFPTAHLIFNFKTKDH